MWPAVATTAWSSAWVTMSWFNVASFCSISELRARKSSRMSPLVCSNIRFLSAEEETRLRTAIAVSCPEHLAELGLALNTWLRLSEQYTIRWQGVSFIRRTLTTPRNKNGATRHIRLNRSALSALKALQAQGNGSKLVCGGTNTPRWWFDPAVKAAGLERFTRHCLRHTFASRLVMAGVDIRTVQELLGHKTIAMTVRYSHLAPEHNLAAVERLDGPTEQPTDTTTDTVAIAQPDASAVILQ
jgi:integrase